MSSYLITAEHWQAALEVPKQIALDLTAPLNLRLQAVRMVQAMLKVILKDEKDRDAPKSAAKSAQATDIKSSSLSVAAEIPTDEDVNIAPIGEVATNEANVQAMPSAFIASPQPDEDRPRYIGRVGPRKIRRKP